jgi:hypothetical protein
MSTRLAVGPSPLVNIEIVEGDLRLVGWENEELLARVEHENDLTLQQADEQISLTCRDDLVLNLPKGSRVHIETVHGDMSVRGLTAELELEAVHGDLAMRDVGSVKLGTIGADFSLRRARGDVHARSVGGDALLRELEGSLTLDSVSDDLAVRAVEGNLKVDVDGDIVAHLDPGPGRECALVAGDDIMVLLPPEANVTLTINAERIKLEWPGLEGDESTSRVITLGDGTAQVKLDAGGDVVVTNRLDAVESAEEYGNFAGMMFDWGGFGRDLGERISRHAQEVAERAARKAETAGRRVERHMRPGPHGRVGVGRWQWNFPSGAPVDPVAPVSDEERMTILRLLGEKKITAEEAAKLLSALEGEE